MSIDTPSSTSEAPHFLEKMATRLKEFVRSHDTSSSKPELSSEELSELKKRIEARFLQLAQIDRSAYNIQWYLHTLEVLSKDRRPDEALLEFEALMDGLVAHKD